MLVTMKPMRGKSSPACHSTLAITRRELFQEAARYEKSWKNTFGFFEGLAVPLDFCKNPKAMQPF